jgi:Flp pilus assembly protein TadG
MRKDHGKIAVYFSIIATSWLVLLAFVVVGGSKVRAYQKADNLATEAARAAGQALNPASAVPGGPKVIDTTAATNAALTYLYDAGATGTVVVAPDQMHLTVTAVVSYQNPTGVGSATWQASGVATATLLVG